MKLLTTVQIGALLVVGVLMLPSGPRAISVEEVPRSSTGDSVIVDWRMLSALDYHSGDVGDALSPFVDREVMIPGFMVPLEDWGTEVSEFLLVPYVGACVHTPPPPPNQLVFVRMRNDEKVPVPMWEPVWVHGKLEVEETTGIYGAASFLVPGDSVTPYEAW